MRLKPCRLDDCTTTSNPVRMMLDNSDSYGGGAMPNFSSEAVAGHSGCSANRVSRHLKPRVLCIDDEPAIGELLHAILEETGNFQVEFETNSLQSLVAAQRFQPDLFIIDVNMPGQNGFEVARQLRQEPWLRQRPIIFFSGTNFAPETLRKAAEGGPTEFLAKGVPLSVIVETVTRATLERVQLYQSLVLERAG
ncbi:MAG: hypothetical protein JWQ44_2601 [Chthoniobacter sp.]|nr:hypothetical protein [Chthoniobacter sp.]